MDRDFLDKKLAALVAVVIAAGMMLSACDNEEETEAPEDMATAFLDNLRKGDQDAALYDLWPPTREELETIADDLETFTDGPLPVDSADLLVVTRLESSLLFASIDIQGDVPDEPDHGEEAPLTIEYRDGRRAQIMLRWGEDDDRWYVDLPLEERKGLHVQQSVKSALEDDEESTNDEPDGDDDHHDVLDNEIVDDE